MLIIVQIVFHWYELTGSRTTAPEEIVPNPKTNSYPNPNPNSKRGAIFLRGNCPDTGDNFGKIYVKNVLKTYYEEKKLTFFK